MEPSLRERKKDQTRAAIFAAAKKLFTTKGYTQTTLSDIAAEANISQRTIFAYFPSKEAIIFYPQDQVIAALFDHIDNRGSDSVFDALRSFDVSLNTRRELVKRQPLIESNTALQEYAAHALQSVERKFVHEIAVERSLSPVSVQAKAVGAVCRMMLSYIMEEPEDEAAGETVLRFIEAGLEATK